MKFIGIFIGINCYLDKRINSLSFAENDAIKLYSSFSNTLSKNDSELRLILGSNATRNNILREIGDNLPRTSKEDDIVLIYFSGHGSLETIPGIENVSKYLITYDTVYGSIYSSSINIETDVKNLFQRIKSKSIILVFDTCFSGYAGGKTFEGPRLRETKRGWRNVVKISDLSFGEGRGILAACDSDEVAKESNELQHGIFTYFFLKSLQGHNSSTASKSILALFDEVYTNVTDYTNSRQHPVLNGRWVGLKIPLLKPI